MIDFIKPQPVDWPLVLSEIVGTGIHVECLARLVGVGTTRLYGLRAGEGEPLYRTGAKILALHEQRVIGEPPWAQIRNLMDEGQRKDKRIEKLKKALKACDDEVKYQSSDYARRVSIIIAAATEGE